MVVTTRLTRTVAVAPMTQQFGVAPCLVLVSRRTLCVLYTLISEREKTLHAVGVASTSRRTLQGMFANEKGRVVALTISDMRCMLARSQNFHLGLRQRGQVKWLLSVQ